MSIEPLLFAVLAILAGAATYFIFSLAGRVAYREGRAAAVEARLSGASGQGIGLLYKRRASERLDRWSFGESASDYLGSRGVVATKADLARGLLTLVLAALILLGSTRSLIVALSLPSVGAVMTVFAQRLTSRRRHQRMKAQVPTALESMAAGLSAGLSLPQAVRAAADELLEPISSELRSVAESIEIGKPLAHAFADLRERTDLTELDTVLVGLEIQRRSGGNLVQLLEGVIRGIYEQRQQENNLRVQTAQTRLSAQVIGTMPLLVASGMAIADPEFVRPLVTTTIGQAMLGTALTFEVVGFLMLRRILELPT